MDSSHIKQIMTEMVSYTEAIKETHESSIVHIQSLDNSLKLLWKFLEESLITQEKQNLKYDQQHKDQMDRNERSEQAMQVQEDMFRKAALDLGRFRKDYHDRIAGQE